MDEKEFKNLNDLPDDDSISVNTKRIEQKTEIVDSQEPELNSELENLIARTLFDTDENSTSESIDNTVVIENEKLKDSENKPNDSLLNEPHDFDEESNDEEDDDLEDEIENDTASEENANKKKKTHVLPIVILLVIAILIGLLIGLKLYGNKSAEKKKQDIYNQLSIEFNDSSNNTFEYGTELTYSNDSVPNEFKSMISSSNGTVTFDQTTYNPIRVGEQNLLFTVTSTEDPTVNKEFYHSIRLEDTQNPTLTIKENEIVIGLNGEAELADNVTALDPVDGNLDYNGETGGFKIDGVNLSSPGEYTATVVAYDRNGNESEPKTFKVMVLSSAIEQSESDNRTTITNDETANTNDVQVSSQQENTIYETVTDTQYAEGLTDDYIYYDEFGNEISKEEAEAEITEVSGWNANGSSDAQSRTNGSWGAQASSDDCALNGGTIVNGACVYAGD